MQPEEVKRIRNLLGLSQEAFGRRVGVTLLTIHRWEAGKSKPHQSFAKTMKRILSAHVAQHTNLKEND